MGVINHNAIIATTYSKDNLDKVVEWVKELKIDKDITGRDPKSLFVFGSGISNDYHTVVLLPDGSKEGWPSSVLGDSLREQFIKFLDSFADYGDEEEEDHPSSPKDGLYGVSCWDWVEVGYGEFGQKILKGNNRNCYGG